MTSACITRKTRAPCPRCGFKYLHHFFFSIYVFCPPKATQRALAAGSRRAKTAQQAECVASQSGGDSRNAQKQSDTPNPPCSLGGHPND